MNKREVRLTPHNIQKRKLSQRVINDLDNVDFIPSNVNSSHQEALLYVFEDNEAVIKMIIKKRSPTMSHVSRTHSQSCSWLVNRSNQFGHQNPNQIHWHQKNNSQTYWPREISHVMNGIVFCVVCLTLAISVLSMVLKWCRKERKIQVKKRSQQSRNRWWIQSRDAANGLPPRYLLLHQKAWRKPNLKDRKYLWNRWMRNKQEQGDLWWAQAHQTTQNGTLTTNGLLKSGNLMNRLKLEQRDLFVNNHPVCTQSTRTNLLLMTMIWTLTRTKNQTVVIIQIILAQGEWSSAKDSRPILKRCNTRQQQTFCNMGESWCLGHWKQLYSWWRITQKFYIPRKIQEKISQWNRCSTYLKIW